jgi:hypothetical protein
MGRAAMPAPDTFIDMGIIPSTPLPEGSRVEILVTEARLEIPADLQAEFEAWDRSSADALALVERLAGKKCP